ncbi:conserved hypothetical protein [Ricinus communis]|uniref:Uncharacterized protein n=1 Tax=Ricinus communis TaxID=3988 RepID=B9RTC9_RICCO|nr:conserved hypothetical protein [Ricinus communis]
MEDLEPSRKLPIMKVSINSSEFISLVLYVGSIIKNISKYYPKEGCKLNEERTKAEAVKAFGKFKIIETYVLTNLDAC